MILSPHDFEVVLGNQVGIGLIKMQLADRNGQNYWGVRDTIVEARFGDLQQLHVNSVSMSSRANDTME